VEWILFLLGVIIGSFLVRYWGRRSLRNNLSNTASQELAEPKNQILIWQDILKQAPVGYLQVDEENHLFFCNAQARNLLSIDPSINLEPNLDSELERKLDRKAKNTEKKLLLKIIRSYELDRLIEETRSTNKARQKEWIFHPTVDDPLHPIEKADISIRGFSLVLANGHIGIFIENRQESILLAQQRDRWAADVAHDLKTPITSIRLIAESLQERVAPELYPWLGTLIKQTIRLSDLVQDILDLGQINMGMPLKLNLATVNVPEIIQSAWNSLEPMATAKQIKLEYWGISELNIEADESKLYRLLLNLLHNSIKHSPPLQFISINVEILKKSENRSQDFKSQAAKSQQFVLLEIIDSGSGFTAIALPHVFDRFYHSAPLEANLQEGSGLGLAIARQIVISHKGTISVDNHPETGGAWVRVTLPCSQA
jgi:two-component system, OmpR family, phosphate regulon sensor histidine kinase PhoR